MFEEAIQMNRLIKNSLLGQCVVKRMKFEGPANPMEIPDPPEDGSEPMPIDEELKAEQFKSYD